MARDTRQEVAGQEPEGGMVARVRRRGRWWIVGTLVALLLVVWLLPMIVAHTPIRDHVLADAFADLDGSISAGSASLGWFSPVVLYDVEVRDPQGKPVLRVPILSGETSLSSLLMDSTRLGRYRLERPQVNVRLGAEGSNIEQLLSHWLSEDQGSSLDSPAVSLEVVDGTVTIDDSQTEQQWKLEKLAVTLALARNWSEPLVAEVTASMPASDRSAQLGLDLSVERTANAGGAPDVAGQVQLTTEALPLELVEPLARRLLGDVRLTGWTTSNLTYAWTARAGTPTDAVLEGEVNGEWLSVSAPPLGRDQVRLDRFALPCRLVRKGDLLTIERLSLDCDVGQAALEGPLTIDLGQPPATEVLAAALREKYGLEGHINLAGLAEMLPETLRLKEETEITGGELSLDIGRRTERGGAAWQGQIEMSNVTAVHRGRQVTWKKPIVVTLSARDGADGPVIDRLIWQSTFLELEAAGTLDYMSASAVYSLQELARQLGQFVDLEGLEMAGDGWSYLSWQRSQDGDFQIDGEFQVRDLSLGPTGRQPWTEDNLIVNTSWTGKSELREIRRINTARIDLESGSDAAHLRLLTPVAEPRAAGTWNVEVQGQGQLATWLPRLAPVIGTWDDWDLAGDGNLEGQLSASADKLKLDETRLVVRQFRATGRRLHIEEPVVQLVCSGEWDRAAQRLSLPAADLSGAALALRARDLSCAVTEGGVQLAGSIAWTGDVARLYAWTADPDQAVERWLAGRLRGQLDFTQTGKTVAGKLDAAVENFAIMEADGHEWGEPRIDLTARGQYQSDLDLLEIDQIALDSESARCEAAGRIAELRGRRELDLRGKFDYDTAALVHLLRPYLGDGVQVTATRDARPFTVRATLAPDRGPPTETRWNDRLANQPARPSLSAQGGIGWTGATLYGFQAGPAEIRGTLSDGLVQIAPLDVTVSDGRLTAAPRIKLWPAAGRAESSRGAELLLDKGPLLARVRINQQMSQRALKYILPILADAAQVEGTISVDLDGGQVPLAAPGQGDLSGRLTVNTVRLQAGPLVQELVFAADTFRRLATNKTNRSSASGLKPVELKRESIVAFRMVEGRIYHRDMVLEFDDVSIHTYGSVGLDQSLALMAEMPIPAQWIGSGLTGAALKDQTLKLPVGGTLAAPKVDAKALEQASAQFVRNGAQGLILEGLNRGLDRLLSPQR